MGIFYRILWKFERMLKSYKLNLLKKRLKKCGSNIKLESSVHVFVPEGLSIGDNTSIAPYTVIYATFGVTIGKNCLISSNCGISSYNHIIESLERPANTDRDAEFSKPVIIGDNVWIGMNSCVLPGITIGDNSIIGSGSVVTKNIPANEIWVGNPAKCIKKINI